MREGLDLLSPAGRRCVAEAARYAGRAGRTEVQGTDLLAALADTGLGGDLRTAGLGGGDTRAVAPATRLSVATKAVLAQAVRAARAEFLAQAGELHLYAAVLRSDDASLLKVLADHGLDRNTLLGRLPIRPGAPIARG